jgi:hypothetical protein
VIDSLESDKDVRQRAKLARGQPHVPDHPPAGHTKPQTAIPVPEEGAVFSGDNIFVKCKTFIQEADPWEWLEALQALAALDVEVIVPGHGDLTLRAESKSWEIERGTGLEPTTDCLEARLSRVTPGPRDRLFELQAGRRGFCPREKEILASLESVSKLNTSAKSPIVCQTNSIDRFDPLTQENETERPR